MDLTINSHDSLIQQHAPLIPMPRYDKLPELEQDRHRFIAAESGLFLEIRRAWLHAVILIAVSDAPLPYGPIAEAFDYAFDETAMDAVLDQFTETARRAMPNECAAWAVWDENAERLDYRPLLADEASPGSVTFHRPRLAPHEHLAIDMHSHGAIAACFSTTDDDDDRGEVKIAAVVGTLDEEPTYATRLCALGHFVDTQETDDYAEIPG